MKDPFTGVWGIDIDGSKVWDAGAGAHVPDEVGEEIITLDIADEVQNYEVLYGDGPVFRMGYTARYDAADWADYTVREIICKTDDPEAEIREFKARIKADAGQGGRRLELGQTYGLVRLIYIDEMTHYRISKNPVSSAGPSVLLRKMEPGGNAYITYLMDAEGVVFRIRRFVRL